MPTLTEQLKLATSARHVAAERSPFMRSLLRGTLALAAYRELLQNLQAIYAVLEAELQRTHPALAIIEWGSLARSTSLASDLEGLAVLGADGTAALLPATEAYVERLRSIGTGDPHLLLAHAYVRYLGDLSGGQILRRIVRDTWQAPTSFYEFGDATSASALVRQLRSALDAAPIDLEGAANLCSEAVEAFEWHVQLFDQLDARQNAAPVVRACAREPSRS